MPRTHYSKRIGEANAICDVCGFKFKTHQLKLRWDGLWTCQADWESRHPQDFLRAHKESNNLPIVKPRPPDVFVPLNFTAVPNEYLLADDFVSTVATMFRDTADVVVFDETIVPISIKKQAPQDTLTFTETTPTSVGIVRLVNDLTLISDSVQSISTMFRSVGDSILNSESVTVSKVAKQQPADTILFSESLQLIFNDKMDTVDGMIFTEDVAAQQATIRAYGYAVNTSPVNKTIIG